MKQLEGQLNIFDYLKSLETVCTFSGHTCNRKELWKVAESLDEIMCPHVCCRSCAIRMCGARCNGSEEPEKIYTLDIRGICDDAYCPHCDSGLDELNGSPGTGKMMRTMKIFLDLIGESDLAKR